MLADVTKSCPHEHLTLLRPSLRSSSADIRHDSDRFSAVPIVQDPAHEIDIGLMYGLRFEHVDDWFVKVRDDNERVKSRKHTLEGNVAVLDCIWRFRRPVLRQYTLSSIPEDSR